MKTTILKFLFSVTGGIIALLQPAIPFVGVCLVAILFDCWTAYRLSGRVKKATGLSSAKFRSKKADRIIDSSINALLFVVLAVLVNDNITTHYGNLYLPNIAAAIIVGVQLVSVCENISSCNESWWARRMQLVFVDKSARHYDLDEIDNKNSIYYRIKGFVLRLLSPTPKKWKRISATALSFEVVLIAIGGAGALFNVPVPEWYTNYAWYPGAALAGLIAYAQSREEKK